MKNSKIANRLKCVEKSAIRQIYDSAPADAINLGLGEIQFTLPEFLKQKANEIIRTNHLGYSANAGLIGLRQTICNYYQCQFNENVCVTAGAEEALFATLFSYLNKNDEVLIANPSFLAYKTIVEMLGARISLFDLDANNNFRINEYSLLSAVSQKTKAMILSNPSNPLGISLEQEEIDLVIDVCSKNNILLIVDEVYRELFLNKRPQTFLNSDIDIIVISSLSKSHCMSGWRIGWAISTNEALISPIIRSHQYICTCAPVISQMVAIEALSPQGMQAKEEIRKKMIKNRNIAVDFLQSAKIGFLSNTSSPYLFLMVHDDDWQIAKDLSELGVIVIPGSAFGSNGTGYIRISYGLNENNLISGLQIIKNYLQIK